MVTGTIRDSLHVLDVIINRDGGPRPDVIATDADSYNTMSLFGLFRMLGYQFSPRLTDLGNQRLWRLNPPGRKRTDYGPLNNLAVGDLNTQRIPDQWTDMLRVTASLHTGIINSADLIRMLNRDGNPTPLGAAFATSAEPQNRCTSCR
ncbi:hypothetical protein BH24ACT5_BH24ACT5_07940 [soil metagenome]